MPSNNIQEATLDLVLEQRENRVNIIKQLQKKYPDKTILSFKLNIPGPIKNNEDYRFAFSSGLQAIDEPIIEEIIQLNNITGPEGFLVIDKPALSVKKNMIKIEDTHPLGRIFDLDVVGVDRSQLNIGPRKCLICDDIAYACSRSRKHSLDTVINKINSMIAAEK